MLNIALRAEASELRTNAFHPRVRRRPQLGRGCQLLVLDLQQLCIGGHRSSGTQLLSIELIATIINCSIRRSYWYRSYLHNSHTDQMMSVAVVQRVVELGAYSLFLLVVCDSRLGRRKTLSTSPCR